MAVVGVLVLLGTGAVVRQAGRGDEAAAPAVTASVTAAPAPGPLDATLGRDAALADLDQAAQAVRDLHPSCAEGCPADFETSARAERSALGDGATVLDLRRAVARLLGSLHDAHTAPDAPTPTRGVPVELVWQDDALRCTWGPCEGRAVTAVDGVPVAEVRERNRELTSFERPELADLRLPGTLTSAEGLAVLGLGGTSGVTLTLDDGSSPTVGLAPVTSGGDGAPTSAVRWDVDLVAEAAVLELRACVFDDTYRQALRSMFATVAAQGLGTVVVDLRDNGGGDDRVVRELGRYLAGDTFRVYREGQVREDGVLRTVVDDGAVDHADQPLFDGRLVVLTSQSTFSSALGFATALHDQGLAQVVGETPAGMPTAHGNPVEVVLDRSGITVRVSTTSFFRPDAALDGEPLTPDVPVPAADARRVALAGTV